MKNDAYTPLWVSLTGPQQRALLALRDGAHMTYDAGGTHQMNRSTYQALEARKLVRQEDEQPRYVALTTKGQALVAGRS